MLPPLGFEREPTFHRQPRTMVSLQNPDEVIWQTIIVEQKSYCYTPGVRVGVRVGVGVRVRMQNVRAKFNVKVMEFQSLCIFSCILAMFIILISPLQQKLMTGAHPVTVAPLVILYFSFASRSPEFGKADVS